MLFSSVNIVLVATSHPGNIGASARAMKNMGFNALTLVSPRSFPDQKANEMASGAGSVLNDAVVVPTLQEALGKAHLVVGMSARKRHLSLPMLSPKCCARIIAEQPNDRQVALVFGREHAGLTNEELLQCHFHVTIEANPEYASLNLSQSVQILTYMLRQAMLSTPADEAKKADILPATMQEVEAFYCHLENVMFQIGFFTEHNPLLMAHMRRLFSRIMPEQKEIAMLRGFLTEIQKALSLHLTSRGKK